MSAGRGGHAATQTGGVTAALWLYGMLVASLAIRSQLEDIAADIVIEAVMSVVIAVWALSFGKQFITWFSLPAQARPWLWASPLLAMMTFAVAYVFVMTAVTLTPVEQAYYSIDYLEAGYGWGTVVFMIAVMPTIFEELSFRGIILGALEQVLTASEALIVSAVLFATIHFSLFSAPHTLAVGFMTGIIRQRTGSLLPCIAIHFFHNLICVGMEAWEFGRQET